MLVKIAIYLLISLIGGIVLSVMYRKSGSMTVAIDSFPRLLYFVFGYLPILYACAGFSKLFIWLIWGSSVFGTITYFITFFVFMLILYALFILMLYKLFKTIVK
jgi:hypothetical protein